MKRLAHFALAIGLSAVGIVSLSAEDMSLQFNSNHKFKIVQFTDIHWIYDDPNSEIAAVRMNEVIEAENPDLIVYTGDVICAKPAAKGLERAFEPAISHGIPFAVVWGNHDDEQDMTRSQLTEYVSTIKGCLISTAEGVTGTSNYVITLKSANSNATSAVLYFLDSNAYSQIEGIDGYDWIHRDQVEWYSSLSKDFTTANNGVPYPALAFFHIPLPEYNDMLPNEKALFVGTRKEIVSAPKINSGLANAMLEGGDVMGVFVGHDHINDFAINWNNILLCYGRYTGGNTVYNNIPGGNGARVIELTEGTHSFRTWIRLKDGKIINEIDFPADTL